MGVSDQAPEEDDAVGNEAGDGTRSFSLTCDDERDNKPGVDGDR